MSDDQRDQCMNSSKVKPINQVGGPKGKTTIGKMFSDPSLVLLQSDLSRKIQLAFGCQNLELNTT